MPEDNQQNNQTDEITLEKLQTDFEQAMDGWKRTAADFENYKRRKEAENKELVEFAKEVTVARLLPILDSLEQALRHMPEYGKLEVGGGKLEEPNPSLNPSPQEEREENLSPSEGRVPEGGEGLQDFVKQYQQWQEGINVLLKQLDKALAEMGVKKIEALGKKFDPHFHEAVREVESDQDDQIVVEELQSGFELNGKVIRPSQVAISKKAKN